MPLTRSDSRMGKGFELLSGFRNKVINGDFDFWRRALSQTSSGYGSDDRWLNLNTGSTKTHSQVAFALGQTDVPGNPKFFSRTVVASVAGAGNFVVKGQRIENVAGLAGKLVTVSFWAKASAVRNLAVEFYQSFGTGGSNSAVVEGIGVQKFALSTVWQKFSFLATLPSIAGKTLGTNGNDRTEILFWFDAGSTFNARTASLGQQSGTFDIAHISVVEGDATAEADPFSPRHVQQEEALCDRYFQTNLPVPAVSNASDFIFRSNAVTAGSGSLARAAAGFNWIFRTKMRATPTVISYAYTSLTSANIREFVSNTDKPAEALTPSADGVTIRPAGAVAAGDSFGFYASADAEL